MAETDDKQRTRELRLVIFEGLAAIVALGVFCWLAFCEGKVPLNPQRWDRDSIAVLANAATVVGIFALPTLIAVGGAELIALIVVRVQQQERARVSGRLRGRAATSPGPDGPRPQTWRSRVASVEPVTGCFVAVVFVFAVVAIGWVAFQLGAVGLRAASELLSPRHGGEPISVKAPTPITSPPRPTATLASYCDTQGGVVVCTVTPQTRSPEALGLAVCRQEGLGRRIFEHARVERRYTFDEYHIPLGTPFTVVCTPTTAVRPPLVPPD